MDIQFPVHLYWRHIMCSVYYCLLLVYYEFLSDDLLGQKFAKWVPDIMYCPTTIWEPMTEFKFRSIFMCIISFKQSIKKALEVTAKFTFKLQID